MGRQSVDQANPSFDDTGFVYPQDNNVETLSGDKTLSYGDASIQVLDPGGAARNVDLPSDSVGQAYLIVNTADAAETITVRDDGDTAVASVAQNEACYFVNTGSGYVALLGAAATDQEV